MGSPNLIVGSAPAGSSQPKVLGPVARPPRCSGYASEKQARAKDIFITP